MAFEYYLRAVTALVTYFRSSYFAMKALTYFTCLLINSACFFFWAMVWFSSQEVASAVLTSSFLLTIFLVIESKLKL